MRRCPSLRPCIERAYSREEEASGRVMTIGGVCGVRRAEWRILMRLTLDFASLTRGRANDRADSFDELGSKQHVGIIKLRPSF